MLRRESIVYELLAVIFLLVLIGNIPCDSWFFIVFVIGVVLLILDYIKDNVNL